VTLAAGAVAGEVRLVGPPALTRGEAGTLWRVLAMRGALVASRTVRVAGDRALCAAGGALAAGAT
jgi:hypothetical protein